MSAPAIGDDPVLFDLTQALAELERVRPDLEMGAHRTMWAAQALLEVQVALLTGAFVRRFLVTDGPLDPRIRVAMVKLSRSVQEAIEILRSHTRADPRVLWVAPVIAELERAQGSVAKAHNSLIGAPSRSRRAPCHKCGSQEYGWSGPSGCSACH